MQAATSVSLTKEQALAKRWLRSGLRSLSHWQWLAGSQSVQLSASSTPSPKLLACLNEFARPLGEHADEHQRKSLASCLDTAGTFMIQCCQQLSPGVQPCVERLLAASLLPLYRGLARGSVTEVCSVMRRQLADCVTLRLLLDELAGDLTEILISAMNSQQSPYECVQKKLDFDLELLTQYLLCAAQKWDGSSTSQLRDLTGQTLKVDWRPTWGTPAVLWRLAGELLADRSEFVVPRDWINVPVPWSEASEHWRQLSRVLFEEASKPSSSIASIPNSTGASSTGATGKLAPDVARAGNEVDTLANGTGSMPGTMAADQSGSLASSKATASTGNQATAPMVDDDVNRLKLEIEIADAVDTLVQASRHATGRAIGNRSDKSHGTAGPRGGTEEFIVPKVIIAEVRSHNDPAFVNVVRRQLGLCRSEEREMSLMAVCVTPDGDEENVPTLQSLGLASWQQKLVNWLSDHPEVHDLYAFVSNEGELILSLMDLERNTATNLLRQGLVEVLTGVSTSGASSAALSRAPVPARYFSGIGSVSSPSAGFEPEQLIEATYRCLEAAQRQGKAAIKSIEVF